MSGILLLVNCLDFGKKQNDVNLIYLTSEFLENYHRLDM